MMPRTYRRPEVRTIPPAELIAALGDAHALIRAIEADVVTARRWIIEAGVALEHGAHPDTIRAALNAADDALDR